MRGHAVRHDRADARPSTTSTATRCASRRPTRSTASSRAASATSTRRAGDRRSRRGRPPVPRDRGRRSARAADHLLAGASTAGDSGRACMKINPAAVRQSPQGFDFSTLFIESSGLGQASGHSSTVEVDGARRHADRRRRRSAASSSSLSRRRWPDPDSQAAGRSSGRWRRRSCEHLDHLSPTRQRPAGLAVGAARAGQAAGQPRAPLRRSAVGRPR